MERKLSSGEGKIVVVTGASSGIGKAVAIQFAALDYTVVLLARRKEALLSVQRQIKSQGGKSYIFVVDLTKPEAVVRICSQIRKKVGHPQILVNNAGIGSFGKTIVDSTLQELHKTFAINLQAVFLITKEVLPAMMKTKEGTIINIGSTYGKSGIPKSSFYCASKFALEGFTEALLEEVRPYNIRVSLISPERVKVESLGKQKPINDNINNYITVEDVAWAVIFCAQESSSAMIKEVIIHTR